MDGLVRQVRIVADVAGRVREPVAPVRKPQEGPEDCEDHIVHVATVGHRRARHRRREVVQVLPPRHPVRHHLEGQAEGQGEGESGHGRPHGVVADAHADPAQLRQPGRHELAAVIVVDGLTGEPHVLEGHVEGPGHGRHEGVVHELLGAVGLRLEADDINPDSQEDGEKDLLHQDLHDVQLPEQLL